MNRKSAVRCIALFAFSMLFSSAFSGCIPRSLSLAMPKNQKQELSKIIGELNDLKPREERPVVVGVGGSPAVLFAWDLEKGTLLWSSPGTSSSSKEGRMSSRSTSRVGRTSSS
jgi:hypothetical protein